MKPDALSKKVEKYLRNQMVVLIFGNQMVVQ